MNDIDKYINHIINSFKFADNNKSKLIEEILNLKGYSGNKTRHFYNNLMGFDGDVRYLEIGVWRGSSFFSSIYNNRLSATCIDNWSQFTNVKTDFLFDLNKYSGNNKINFIENDCFKVDVNNIGKFNFYLYDGNHTPESHYNALKYYIHAMDDIFVYVVDDWNWEIDVKIPTMKVISDLNLEVLYKNEILCELNDRVGWWNGIGVFLLKKYYDK